MRRRSRKRINWDGLNSFIDEFVKDRSPARQDYLVKAIQKRYGCTYNNALRKTNIYLKQKREFEEQYLYAMVQSYGTVLRKHIVVKEEVT